MMGMRAGVAAGQSLQGKTEQGETDLAIAEL